MLTVTAIFETNNCRTWISGEAHNVAAKLNKAQDSSPRTYKLIRIDKGETFKSKKLFNL